MVNKLQLIQSLAKAIFLRARHDANYASVVNLIKKFAGGKIYGFRSFNPETKR